MIKRRRLTLVYCCVQSILLSACAINPMAADVTCEKNLLGDNVSDDIVSVLDPVDYVIDPEPICEISNGTGLIFTYDEDMNRMSKEGINGFTEFIYENGRLTEEKDNDITICFEYDEIVADRCVSIIVNGTTYNLIYDAFGSVVEIADTSGNVVCKYDYADMLAPIVYRTTDGEETACVDEWFIGNINPIRYQGWYYDEETFCYYYGKGAYYDVVNNEHIINEFSFDTDRYVADMELSAERTSSSTYSSRTISSSALSSYYTQMLNSTNMYVLVSNVSESAWKAGGRWYAGRNSTEIVARCIMAESAVVQNDQTAVAYVIANHANSSVFPSATTAISAVTRQDAFSTINPKYISGGSVSYADAVTNPTYYARQAFAATSTNYKHAIYLSCVLYYSTKLSDMDSVLSRPSGIGSYHLSYLAWNNSNKSRITFANGKYYFDGNEIIRVVIAGVGEFAYTETGMNALLNYAGQNRNVFFRYADLNLY